MATKLAEPPKGAEPPEPLYACVRPYCAEEVTNPADRMYWSEKHGGWACFDCCHFDPEVEHGIRLDVWLEAFTPTH